MLEAKQHDVCRRDASAALPEKASREDWSAPATEAGTHRAGLFSKTLEARSVTPTGSTGMIGKSSVRGEVGEAELEVTDNVRVVDGLVAHDPVGDGLVVRLAAYAADGHTWWPAGNSSWSL